MGFLSNSLALIADAGHNLGDVLALLLSWGATYLAQRKPTNTKTYGLRRGTILAAFISSLILLMTMSILAWEALGRFTNPAEVNSMTIIVVAAIGVMINTATALLFFSSQHDDLNIKAAFIHMAADAGVSLGVVIAGGAIMFTSMLWIDPAISLVIVVVIVISTWGVFRDSFNLAMDGVPKGIDVEEVRNFILQQDGITEIHDLHVWAMSTTQVALTAHLVRDTINVDDQFLHRLSKELHERFKIIHPTIQIESGKQAHLCGQAHHDSV
ncbi:MAG: cation diffusion facilitator family transporter [Gammaproteobacteria bacterium]|nr:cation diffusion facilitator family transporter [Gammaproteobacteria bacterium]